MIVKQKTNLIALPQKEIRWRKELLKHWYEELDRCERYKMKIHVAKHVSNINDMNPELEELQEWEECLTFVESYFRR